MIAFGSFCKFLFISTLTMAAKHAVAGELWRCHSSASPGARLVKSLLGARCLLQQKGLPTFVSTCSLQRFWRFTRDAISFKTYCINTSVFELFFYVSVNGISENVSWLARVPLKTNTKSLLV